MVWVPVDIACGANVFNCMKGFPTTSVMLFTAARALTIPAPTLLFFVSGFDVAVSSMICEI